MSTIRSPIASLLTMVANSTVLSHHIRAMFCPVHREAVTPFHEKDIRNDTLRTTQSSLVRLAFSPLVCISFSCVKSRWRDEGFDTRYGTRVWSPPRSRSPGWPRYGGGVGSAGVPVASGNSRRPLLSRCEGLSLKHFQRPWTAPESGSGDQRSPEMSRATPAHKSNSGSPGLGH